MNIGCTIPIPNFWRLRCLIKGHTGYGTCIVCYEQYFRDWEFNIELTSVVW